MAGAPPEVFEWFRFAAQPAFDPDDYRSVAGRFQLA